MREKPLLPDCGWRPSLVPSERKRESQKGAWRFLGWGQIFSQSGAGLVHLYHGTFCWCLEISSRLNIENRSAPSVRRCVWWGEPWNGFDTPLFREPPGSCDEPAVTAWAGFPSLRLREDLWAYQNVHQNVRKIEESEGKMTSFSIDPTVCDLIFEQTNGHVGAIRTFLFHGYILTWLFITCFVAGWSCSNRRRAIPSANIAVW